MERLEEQAATLAAGELGLAEAKQAPPEAESPCILNTIDAHRLLSILAGLGDQLHQVAAQSEQLPSATRQVLLGQADLSRAHTALGRLGSLLSLPTDTRVSPFTLAEHGVCNTMDTQLTSGLRFYQHLSVGLENIFDLPGEAGSSDIQASLEAQFKSNLMLRGYDSWNVPLHRSLNAMPPQSHYSTINHSEAIP